MDVLAQHEEQIVNISDTDDGVAFENILEDPIAIVEGSRPDSGMNMNRQGR